LEKNLLNNEYEKQIILLKEYEKYNKIKSTLKDILNLYDRGFREYILIKKINIFESKINNIIRNLSNYEIKIEVDKNNVKFYKIIENKLLNVRKLCGFERIAFNIGFRLALNNMNVMTKNNFIIIDEGFSSSDQNNLQKIPYLLDVIKKEYDIGIIISHIDEIKNQEGKIINILYNEKTKDSLINII
jgi:DNA repair exonuclease SbcCD ATPase subunit